MATGLEVAIAPAAMSAARRFLSVRTDKSGKSGVALGHGVLCVVPRVAVVFDGISKFPGRCQLIAFTQFLVCFFHIVRLATCSLASKGLYCDLAEKNAHRM